MLGFLAKAGAILLGGAGLGAGLSGAAQAARSIKHHTLDGAALRAQLGEVPLVEPTNSLTAALKDAAVIGYANAASEHEARKWAWVYHNPEVVVAKLTPFEAGMLENSFAAGNGGMELNTLWHAGLAGWLHDEVGQR